MHLFNQHHVFIYLIVIYTNLWAQTSVDLPSHITLIIDNEKVDFTDTWLDSLIDEAVTGKFCFKIAGVSSTKWFTTSHIQLPQILSLNEVYRQIILYFALIPEENLREKEKIMIYPYFQSREGDPSFIARYYDHGTFEIEIISWEQIAVPKKPGLREMRIFNQVLQTSFKEIQSFCSLKEEIFEEVAIINHLTSLQVMEIYQNTILWQHSLYFCRLDSLEQQSSTP